MSPDFEDRLQTSLREHADRAGPGADDPVGEVRRRARRQDRRHRLVAGAGTLAVVGVAVAILAPVLRSPDVVIEPGPDDPPAADQPAGAEPEAGVGPDDADALAHACENPDAGYEIRYPEGWHTNDAQVTAPCRFFHPEPFTLDPATDESSRAVAVTTNPRPLEEFRDELTTSTLDEEVLVEEDVTVDERDAVRVEIESGGGGMLPEGTRSYTHAIDVGDATITVTTHGVVSDIDYDEAKAVHERMLETLEIYPDEEAERAFGDTDPITGEGDGPTAALADLRVGTHADFDRVVLAFDDDVLPDYEVAYDEAPTGEHPAGETVLAVRLEPAAVAREGYAPGDHVRGESLTVTEATFAGEGDGTLEWLIGLDGDERAFRVQTLEEPARLVIDVRA